MTSGATFFFYLPSLFKSNKTPPSLTLSHSLSTTTCSSCNSGLRCLSSHSVEMEGTAEPILFPLHRSKTLHLVRHAQGIHNVEAEKDHKAFLSQALFDAQLTPLGWKQVDHLRKHVRSCGLSNTVELVVTSPLLRTMQTAVGVFGGGSYEDGVDVPPLMVANAGNSDRSAYSSLNCPPFIAIELCREHLGVRPCDKRRSISEYLPLFPAIDFSLVESDEDIWWKADLREPNEGVTTRGMKFFNWLWTRKEKEIAVVTHSGFLFHTLKELGNRYHPLMNEEICKQFLWLLSAMHHLYYQLKAITKIQKFRRVVSYAGFYCFVSAMSYWYTNNTTRAGTSRGDQFYASFPAGTELLTDTAKLYKAALGNCFEIEEWGPIEFSIMAKHFDRQGKPPYAYHSQYMAHLLSHGQLDGSGA